MSKYTSLEVSVAISLYHYNVPPVTRAKKLYEHFGGNCAEPEELVRILHETPHIFATELAQPAARVYIQHALEKYGQEARERVFMNDMPFEDIVDGKKPKLDIDSGDVSLTLKRSSWENIFRVLKWCAPMDISEAQEKTYHDQTGDYWTIGNFWASVQRLQQQFEENSEKRQVRKNGHS